MTLSTQISKASYAGNGVTSAFPVAFPFIRDADITALLSHDGVEIPLLQGTHYALSGAGEPGGGSLSMLTPPATGQTLVIRRDPAIVQELDYVENSAFPAASHERALDLLTMICQALDEKVRRAVLYPISTPSEQIKDSRAFLDTCEGARVSAQADAAQSALQAQAAALSAQAARQSVGGLRVSAGDTAPGTLSVKLEAGDGLAESLVNPGGDERLRLALAPAPDGGLETDQGLARVRLAPGGGLSRSYSGLSTDAHQIQAALLALAGAYTRQQYAVPVTLSGQSGSVALDADLHQDVEITATGNITLAAPTNPAKGKTIFLTLYAASALTIAWNAVFKGNADYPTLDAAFVVGKRLFFQFRCIDGTNWLLLGHAQEA